MRILLSSFNSEVLTVGTAPVKLAGVKPTRPTTERLALVLLPSGNIFIGGQDVSSANGMPVASGEKISFDSLDGVWAVATANTQVNILEGF